MHIGMVGLGRMGGNMVRRLQQGGHHCVVYDRNIEVVADATESGAVPCTTLQDLVAGLTRPRTVWLMVPAGAVDSVLAELVPLLEPDDIVVDGGNTAYQDDIRRSADLGKQGIHYMDVGTSGGVRGLERGYCLMVGGSAEAFKRIEPVLKTLSPGIDAAAQTPGRNRQSSAEQGYLHCGPNGAGHFVKMVHNGIEYGLMAAYAEGLNMLRKADIGQKGRKTDAETAPLRHPEHFQYDFDIADITELWRRGSVIGSWLLDLTAQALVVDPQLEGFNGHVSDSGEGRWAMATAVEQGVPVPVLGAALFSRFESRGNADYANRLLSAMRSQFGGHVEKSRQEHSR